MTRPIVVFDLDDCLFDYIGGFAVNLSKRSGLPVSGLPRDRALSEWSGLSADMVRAEISAFNETDPEFFRLAPSRGAREAVDKFHAAGYRIYGLTSSVSPERAAGRARNVLDVFGPVFDDVVCLPLGADKSEALARIGGQVFLDDMPHNIIAGLSAGYRSCLMSVSSNLEDKVPGAERVCGWKGLVNLILPRAPGITITSGRLTEDIVHDGTVSITGDVTISAPVIADDIRIGDDVTVTLRPGGMLRADTLTSTGLIDGSGWIIVGDSGYVREAGPDVFVEAGGAGVWMPGLPGLIFGPGEGCGSGAPRPE